MTMADTVYVVSLFVALAVIFPPLTEATGPSNPVPLPVRLEEPVYLTCYPLHSELPLIREAGWSVYNPEHDNWTSVVGIDKSNNQANGSWEIKSFVNNPRFSVYGPSHIFLKIDKVTKEDIGTEWRCVVSTWEWVHHKPEAIHYNLTLLDDSKEENMPITKLVQPTTNQVSAGKKTTEENTPITTLVQPTTNRVTEGKKTAEGEPNESDKGNSCSVCAVTGSLSTLALVVICSLLYLCRERLLTSAVHLFDCQREVDLGNVSADNSSRLSSGDVVDGEEFWSEGNCRSLAELRTTSDDIRVKCSDGEATSSGTQESYPDPLPHTCTYNVTSSL